MNIERSRQLFSTALKLIPGGVNSPVRAFKSVGGNPLFISRGEGSKIYDVDGNVFIDYVGSWGPHLFGHKPPFIIEAISRAIENGLSFGAPIELEIQMAELIRHLVPSIEMVRMVNSGTEATMSAIRLARGATGRSKIIKFEGCYHGHADCFLIKAGSGALTFGAPTSPGITSGTVSDTLPAIYNNIESVEEIIEHYPKDIAALIIEPVAGNMGVIKAEQEFLEKIRELCTRFDIILIFDEVMSGFRLSSSGAQGLYNIAPDLTCFGKIIGGGLPVGAYGGKESLMKLISPSGDIYQAGTLSGNPLAMSAGVAALEYINGNPNIYNELETKSSFLESEIEKCMPRFGLRYTINRVGSMICLFFSNEPVRNLDEAMKSDTAMFSRYFRMMLDSGIYLAPSQYEAFFVSLAHSDEDLNYTIDAFEQSMKLLV